jgi:hypothetical protein
MLLMRDSSRVPEFNSPIIQTTLQLLVISSKGEVMWENGNNRRFSLAFPSEVSSPQGGFLVMLHYGLPSTEPLFFPALTDGEEERSATEQINCCSDL